MNGNHKVPDLSYFEQVFDWIESHEKTVDLLKWATVLLLAWAVGIFKFIRQRLRQPVASIEMVSSRCLLEDFSEFRGHKNVVRASFLIEVGLMNPTSEPVVIRHFSLAVRRKKFWHSWKPLMIALTLPSRPRHEMGSGTKLLKSWFSNFPDGFRELTLSGTIEPKQLHSGFLLFVCFAQGSWAPRLKEERVSVRALVHLTTGETRIAKGNILVTRDRDAFESWVPGIMEQISHESAWGAAK